LSTIWFSIIDLTGVAQAADNRNNGRGQEEQQGEPKELPVILVAGLTPAWQQIVLVDGLAVGAVNRVREAFWCASGKVLNASRALHCLSASFRAVTLVGGAGDAIRRDCEQLGMRPRWIPTASATRVCTTVLDASRSTATELVPNAASIDAAEQDAFLSAYAEEAPAANVALLIGSLPEGAPTDFYRQLIKRIPGKVILDARAVELLECLPTRPFLVKPNRLEFALTLGRDLSRDADLFTAMRDLNRRGAEWVVVTHGGQAAHAACSGDVYRFELPEAEVVNPIGCGDCTAAGIAWATNGGQDPLDAIRFGLAAGVDKVSQLLPGTIDRNRVERIAHTIRFTRIV
jgi:1-phosphofructokinase family hexose kinase